MANQGTGSYFLLFLSLFNLVALGCVIVYNIHYANIDTKQDNFRETFFQEIKDDITELFNGRSRRDTEQKEGTEYLLELENILQDEKHKLLEECRLVAKDDVIKLLKEALTYIQPLESANKHKRQTNAAGNELASIFGEIAKTEVDILSQYCGNNSHICLPGEKGDKGDAGLVGMKGAQGTSGVQGLKGDRGDAGMVGLKGDPGQLGPQGPPGIKGDFGPKGDVGMYGVPGTKGQRGVMGPQGMKGELGHFGIKGDKGDTGLDGTNGVQGMRGPKGDKGDSADVPAPSFLPTSTQCCTSLSVPKFTEQLQEIRVTEGSNVTLTCNPRGYPVPSVSWTPDPNGINPRASLTRNTLTMANVRPIDSQTFSCLAKNVLGTSQKNYVLSVYQHLKFNLLPQNYTVMTGNPVTLECKIDGPLDPKITWYKVLPDGSKSLVTNGIITTSQNISQLHIDHVNSAVEGQYMCEGHNGVENVQMSAYLKTYGPPHIRPQGQITLLKGQTARLKCQADAEPPATITWTYPPGVTNAYVDSDGSLVIMNANSRDSRYFICTAQNKYGTDQEQLTVVVKFPAEVAVTPAKIAVDPGKTTIALQCAPEGDTPLTVEWFKDGIPVAGNSHVFVLPGNVLLINQANSADIGVYTCRASNPLGSATATSYAYFDARNVQCPTTFAACTEHVCRANCPGDCMPSIAVQLGATQYTQSSSICKAALMSGVIPKTGGEVMWRNAGFRAELLGINQTPSP